MNWDHLETFVWLRWRLAANQIMHSGTLGVVVSMIFTVLMVGGGLLGLLAGFIIGFVPLRPASPRAIMLVWDGAIAGFLLFWIAGLFAELQRSDAISLDRFLHLPVTPTSAFLINFLGSSVSLGLVLFLPGMIGLAAGLALSRGAGMLWLFPLVAAFFLMVTAVTYQFRGWLASLMANPRRRRAILALAPLLLFLTIQIPNLVNVVGAGPRGRRSPRADSAAARYEAARRVNMVAPPGWLAFGAEGAAEGRVWPPLAGIIGMAAIGALSLRRAYGTTLRLYTGDFNTRPLPRPATPGVPSTHAPAAPPALFMQRRLPWVSDGASAVALAGLRSWMRAPEMKMMMLSPLFVLVVFTGMFRRSAAHELLRTLQVTGLVAFLMVLGMLGAVGNQFGFDRSGFRALVLSPLPRRDVLLGKNLSVLPYAVAATLAAIAGAQWFAPIRIDHAAGVLVQAITMYLVLCVAGNVLSIVAPMALKPGSGVPAPNQGIRQVFPLLFVMLIPAPLGLTLLPLGIESLLVFTGWLAWFPAYVVLGAVQAVVAVWLYRITLDWQGTLLHRRERDILEVVASRVE